MTMRRLIILVFSSFFAIPVSPVYAALSPLEREAAENTAQACAQSLAHDGSAEGIGKMAVFTLDNDDGEITDLLIDALTQAQYDVASRDEIESVMSKHSLRIQRLDARDKPAVQRLGKLLEVDGLFFGSVEEKFAEPYHAYVKLDIELVDARTGKRIWSEVVIGSAREPHPQKFSRTMMLITVLVCGVLILLWLVSAKRKPSGSPVGERKDRGERQKE